MKYLLRSYVKKELLYFCSLYVLINFLLFQNPSENHILKFHYVKGRLRKRQTLCPRQRILGGQVFTTHMGDQDII